MSIDKNTGPGGIGASYGRRTTLAHREYDTTKKYGDIFREGGEGPVGNPPGATSFREQGGVVAAFYYGEWGLAGPSYNPTPWASIQPYSDRFPVIAKEIDTGVYGVLPSDADAVRWEQQQALNAGIDVFIHNVYWFKDANNPNPGVNFNITDVALSSHMNCSDVPQKIAMMWTNHSDSITTQAELDACFDYMMYWISNFRSKYWHIDDRPVFYIYSMDHAITCAKAVFNESNDSVALGLLITYINNRANWSGLGRLYIVSASGIDHPYWTGDVPGWTGLIERAGFDAQTVYNRHHAFTERVQNSSGGSANNSTKYPALLNNYEQLTKTQKIADDWIIDGSGAKITIQANAMSGWDMRPWLERDGAPVRPEDNCASTPSEFREALYQQRDAAVRGTRGKVNTPPVLTLYAWNEYGEGGFLAPSRRYGWSLLDQITEVFGKSDFKAPV